MWPFDESKQLPPLPSKALLHDRSLPPLPPEAQHAEGMAYKPAAFLSLPNELLDRIFLLSISTSFPVEDLDYPRHPLFSKGASFTGNSACHAPHLLASVLSQTCRRFRSLLLHSPLLWSYIFVTRPAPIRSPRSSTSAPTQPSPFIETHGLDKWLSWLPRYISHSQNTPLHIVLDTTRYPLHHSMSGLEGNETPVHPFRYIAATSERWNSLTILTFHLGSQSLPPTLSLLAHVSVPNLENFRVAADIWRDGISSHGDLPPFFVKGAPKLKNIRLDGAWIGWDQNPLCPGFHCERGTSASTRLGEPGGRISPSNHNMLRSLELNFATRYPSFVVLRNMLENGCPHLESLIIRDDLDAALRLIKPPPCPYLDEGGDGDQRLQAFSRNEQFDWRSHNSSRIPSPTPSESSSSSDTTVDRPIRTAKYKVELTPIRLVALKHLEIGLHRPQANCKQASSTTPARFLHLFSTPRLASFVITNIRWAEWVTFADVVGLPEDPTSFIQDGRGLREGSGTRGASSTYPLLQHLDISFCD
ncbi:hypothetical protein BKA70DRAFT_192826 [Coprinopsis sp. MPI-PUGE-AT-0042]|nr:hypothetical protein BKA70DRAFT_192826 [Coprinopsis sp. MPI-PUGE-AT-0042]